MTKSGIKVLNIMQGSRSEAQVVLPGLQTDTLKHLKCYRPKLSDRRKWDDNAQSV